MIQKTKRPVSILLVLLMIVGMFSVLPISAGAAATDFSSDKKVVFVTDAQNWDYDGVLYAYYWKVETSYPAPDYNKVETVVDGDWVATKYLYDNSMNQSVYGVLIPDDANRVLFNRDDNRKTTDTSNVYDGSWWYIDENKNCVPVSGDVFDTCEQTCCLSNEFYGNTASDSYYKLDNHYYYVSDTILDYVNDLGATADQLLVAEVVGGDNNGKKFTCVNEAVAAAGEGGEVKLISDIMSNVGIDGDYTTTLDLNGHTITNTSGSGITLYSKYNGDKTFTIKDTSENQTGAITINKKYAGDGCISDSSGRKVVIEGGTYTSDANALYVSSDNGWTINGGTFYGNIKVVSELDVTGGTINGNINATGPSWTEDPAEVTISGGTVTGSLNTENGSTYTVSGGTFSSAVPEAYCADGYIPTGADPETGKYTVKTGSYVAQIGDTKYETLAAAIDAAQTGDTITLLDDIALTGANWFVVDNKDLTIDLGGKNISSEDSVFVLKNGADLTVENGTMTTSVSGDYAIYVNNGSVFTLNNDATLKATNSNGNGIIVRDGGKAVINGTVESGYYSIAGFGSAVVDVNAGASITSTNASALSGNGSDGNEGYTFNINGGTLTSVNDVAIYHPNQGTLNITGGTITGATAIYVKSGTTDISTSTTSISGATITGNGAAKELVHSGNGCNPTGDAIVIENCGYPGGTPAIDISGGIIVSNNADPVHSYGYNDYEPIEKFVSGGTFSEPVPADYCADGYIPVANTDGTYTVAPHEHDWDYENVSWTFTENPTTHSIYAKYTLTCKTDPTHTKEQTGSGTLMSTVAVDGDKFVYSHSAVKIDGISVAVPNYTRNIADGIINQYELKAAAKVAGEYKLANDITGFNDSVKPVDGFVLDGQNHMIKYGTINAGGRVMFVAADQNTKFTLKNITLDGNNRAKWAVCAYTGNSGNNAGNVITLDTVTIQNFKSNDYVGAINAFGSSTWNLKDCTITGNTTVDDSDGLSGSAVWAGSKATINIDGGTYDEVYLHSYSGTGAVLNADGGATINNLVLDLTKTDTLKANIDEATVGKITSNEGTIPEEAVVMDPAKATVAAPEGYKWVDSDETGMKTLAQIVYVAQIGETKYETLEAAFAAAEDGDTITVLASSAGNGIKVPQGKFATGLTVDFAGYTYTVNANTVGSTGTETQGFQLLKNNKITFKNGTINGSSVETATLKFLIQNYSDLTLDKMNLELVGKYYNQYTLSNNNGNIVINDSTINAPTYGGVVRHDVNSYAFDVCRYASYPSVNVTVTGNSTINGDVQVDAGNGEPKNGFSLNLNGGTMSGDIKLTANAETAIDNNPDKASVNKKNTFNQDPAEGYEWKDNGDGTSTLAKIVDLFAGYGLTLQGDIGLIFYLDPAAVGVDVADVSRVSVSFTCDKYTGTVTDFETKGNYIKVKYYVPAAYMASTVHAYAVSINGISSIETNDYSVQQYAQRIITDPVACGIDAEKADEAVALMKEMLNYGSKAQVVFASQMQNPISQYAPIADYTMAKVTVANIDNAIEGDATDMTEITPEEGAKFYGASVIYLSKTTLRMVFAIPSGAGSQLPASEYDGHQGKWYHWVEKTDIPAAELHKQQNFEVNGVTFNYSALDYAKAVLNSNMDQANKDLVSALYLYNQAAIAYYAD